MNWTHCAQEGPHLGKMMQTSSASRDMTPPSRFGTNTNTLCIVLHSIH